MKLRYGLGLLIAAGLSVLAALPALKADEKPKLEQPAKAVDVGSLPEVQDIVFYTEKRPILMRLHVFIDDKPATERWEAFQKKLFDYLDVDGDGFLSKEEAKRIPAVYTLEEYFTGGLAFNGRGGPGLAPAIPPGFEDIDTDRDGKISPQELALFYRRSRTIQAITGAGRGNAQDQLTNAIFAALDTNKDGKLSKEELQLADKRLLQFDDNDDEMVTAQEILATAANPFGVVTPVRQLGQPSIPASILLVTKEENKKSLLDERRKLTKEILARYDKDQNNKLSREEIGFPKELFDALDRNKDGQLSEIELLFWVIASPDVEFTVRMGKIDAQHKLIEANGDGKPRNGLKLATTSTTTLALGLDGSEVSVVRGDVPRGNGGGPQQLEAIRRVFKMIDTDGKGFITLKQLDNNRQAAFLRPIFAFADRDGNEKLTEKELEAYVEFVTAAQGCQTTITFSDNGQGLFDLLDSNGDGRLSIREMRNSWSRLAIHDRDGDGVLSKSEIPRQYELLVGQGRNQGFPGQFQPVGRDMAPPRRGGVPQRGPLWFRKMDVNGDGDVSEREFLGSKEDFRRINVSGDGLISVEEAEKADEWFRQKGQSR